MARGKTPFIYTSYYEGRSCSPYLYVDAWVPDQQVASIVDYFMAEKGAKTFFLAGSDYAFGRGMLEFTRKYIESKGGKVIDEEYLPMDASDWTAVISKIRNDKPDALITSTAGGAPNVTLTKQLRASGVNVLFGNLGVDEGTAKSIGADATGVYIAQSYLTSIDTPQNKAFIAGLQKMFGNDMKTPNDLSEPEYDGIYLYKAAVEKAGSFDEAKVLSRSGAGHLRRPARPDQYGQRAPRSANDVSRPGAGGRQREGDQDLRERRSRRPVPEAEVTWSSCCWT